MECDYYQAKIHSVHDAIRKKSLNDFISLLHEYNFDQKNLENIANEVMLEYDNDFVRNILIILINDFNFEFTTEFFVNNIDTLNIYGKFPIIINAMGDSFFEKMNNGTLRMITTSELQRGSYDVLKKLINKGYDINKIIWKNDQLILYIKRLHNGIEIFN